MIPHGVKVIEKTRVLVAYNGVKNQATKTPTIIMNSARLKSAITSSTSFSLPHFPWGMAV
jgi:hypothetical protein